jgi:hypothetical protein
MVVGLDAQINNALTVFTDCTVQAGQSNFARLSHMGDHACFWQKKARCHLGQQCKRSYSPINECLPPPDPKYLYARLTTAGSQYYSRP